MTEINKTATYPIRTPALLDMTIGTDVSDTAADPDGKVVNFTWQGVLTLFQTNIALGASAITSGTLANGRISEASVTQHEGALGITESQISDLGATVVLDSDIGTTVQAFDSNTLKANQSDNIEVGYTTNSPNLGTRSSGTETIDPTVSVMQRYVNGGAHTLASPTQNCCLSLKITNNSNAGAITLSGFGKTGGDAFTTVDGAVFMCTIIVNNGTSELYVSAH